MDSLRNFLCSSLHMFKSSFWAEKQVVWKKTKDTVVQRMNEVHRNHGSCFSSQVGPLMSQGGRLWGLHFTKSHHSIKGQTAGKQDFVRLIQNTLLKRTDNLEVAQLDLVLFLCSFYRNMYILRTELVGCIEFWTPAVFLTRRIYRGVEAKKKKKAVVTNPVSTIRELERL